MKVFPLNSTELLLPGYEPLIITSEDTRSHRINSYEVPSDSQKEQFQQIIVTELTFDIPQTIDTTQTRPNDDALCSDGSELLNHNPTKRTDSIN